MKHKIEDIDLEKVIVRRLKQYDGKLKLHIELSPKIVYDTTKVHIKVCEPFQMVVTIMKLLMMLNDFKKDSKSNVIETWRQFF